MTLAYIGCTLLYYVQLQISYLNQSTVAHWYAICLVLGGPVFKSRQGRELLILYIEELLRKNSLSQDTHLGNST